MLPLLRSSSRWLIAAPLVLGVHGPSRYLVLLQNPAELRATGGFIGAADFVTVRNGSIESRFTQSALPHEIDSVSTPLPEALYTAEGPWIFRDSNWSPDFPLSARLARWFFGEDTSRWADGVIAVDDPAIGPILRATGPVYLPTYHQWVGGNNVARLAQHYVKRSYHGPVQKGSLDAGDKQFLGNVVAALLQRIESLSIDRWPALVRALADAGSRRDTRSTIAVRPSIQRSGCRRQMAACGLDPETFWR
jgi:Protein of unknown function (DUF4012)